KRRTNDLGAIAAHRQMNRRWQLRLEDRQQAADGVGDLDRVRARLTLHLHVDGALTAFTGVEPRDVARVLDAVEHVGDLLQTNWRALAIRDDDRSELFRVVQLPGGLDVE